MSSLSSDRSPVKYHAYTGGVCLEVSDDLDALIALMVKDSRGSGEDVVIWSGSTVAAIIYADGSQQLMQSEGPGWMRLPPEEPAD